MSDARRPADSDRNADTGARPAAGVGLDRTGVDLDVPAGAEVFACERCDERFPRERQRDLHRGLDHSDDLTPAEREAYAAASADEGADLRRFQIVSLGLLVLLYFGFLFLYAVAGTGDAGAVAPLVVIPGGVAGPAPSLTAGVAEQE